ncbi:Protein transport protein Sec24-like [Vitis vinifera]|uniref:Protein transport protein Sec24-like n=1 Tax=Vitis vinifera TaxID=29760 RepID=A0A438J4Y6_VITVI|nr:Protein transport protein Sec24-like [Vitis vinifera]
MPFLSSGPVVGSQASGFRPTPSSTPQAAMPFLSSGPVVGPETSGFRPTPPGRFSDPSLPSVPSANAPPTLGPFQRFTTPQNPSTAQAPPARPLPVGQPVFPPPVQPPAGQVPPVSFRPHFQTTVSAIFSPTRVNLSCSKSQFTAIFPGYPSKQSNAVPQAPAVQSPFLTQQGGYAAAPPTSSPPFLAQPGGYIPPPPVAAPLGLHSREQMQHPGTGPPIGAVQGLIEDFSSLSVGSVPGSIDLGIDSKALPRPLEGDVEPNSFAEMYPMNCHSRYLRLTTSGIPNSQSLVSRWHLPLGAVVCPLAVPPDGEEVPIVNFAATGIIRCRRCRTYVNPYVTFTDGGRSGVATSVLCSMMNQVLLLLLLAPPPPPPNAKLYSP